MWTLFSFRLAKSALCAGILTNASLITCSHRCVLSRRVSCSQCAACGAASASAKISEPDFVAKDRSAAPEMLVLALPEGAPGVGLATGTFATLWQFAVDLERNIKSIPISRGDVKS